METPLPSAGIIYRSQAVATLSAGNFSEKIEYSGYEISQLSRLDFLEKKRKMLVDSPILGVVLGNLETPLSSISKQMSIGAKKMSGTGESFLRAQVKTLCQETDESFYASDEDVVKSDRNLIRTLDFSENTERRSG